MLQVVIFNKIFISNLNVIPQKRYFWRLTIQLFYFMFNFYTCHINSTLVFWYKAALLKAKLLNNKIRKIECLSLPKVLALVTNVLYYLKKNSLFIIANVIKTAWFNVPISLKYVFIPMRQIFFFLEKWSHLIWFEENA